MKFRWLLNKLCTSKTWRVEAVRRNGIVHTKTNIPVQSSVFLFEPFGPSSVDISSIPNIVVPSNRNQTIFPPCVRSQNLNTAIDICYFPRHSMCTFEDSLPESLTSAFKLFVIDPLASKQVSQHNHMGRIRPPVNQPIDVCQVEIVAPKVQLLSIPCEYPRRVVLQQTDQCWSNPIKCSLSPSLPHPFPEPILYAFQPSSAPQFLGQACIAFQLRIC